MTDPDIRDGGCGFGSPAAEVMKSEPGLHDEIAAGFHAGGRHSAQVSPPRDRGALRGTADLDLLASVLMAAFQGGMLLTQAPPTPRHCATRCTGRSTTSKPMHQDEQDSADRQDI